METLDTLLAEATPDLVRHCVGSYMASNPGSDTSQAFAICVSTMQKSGYVEPGSLKLTGAGKTKEKEHENEKDAGAKKARYHAFLKAARESVEADEDEIGITEALAEGVMTGALGAALGHYATRAAARVYHDSKMNGDPHHHAAELMKKVSKQEVDDIDIKGSTKHKRGVLRGAAAGAALFLGQDALVGAGIGAVHGTHVARLKALERLKERNPEAFAKARKLAGLTPAEEPKTAEESAVAEIENLLLEGQPRGPGRPAVPVGTVRRWTKEGHTVAMVKVGEPSVWIHKKQKASAHPGSHAGHAVRPGTVRRWKKRTMVKVSPGHWVTHKAKHSQEDTNVPTAPVITEGRVKLRDRLLEQSDLANIAKEHWLMLSIAKAERLLEEVSTLHVNVKDAPEDVRGALENWGADSAQELSVAVIKEWHAAPPTKDFKTVLLGVMKRVGLVLGSGAAGLFTLGPVGGILGTSIAASLIKSHDAGVEKTRAEKAGTNNYDVVEAIMQWADHMAMAAHKANDLRMYFFMGLIRGLNNVQQHTSRPLLVLGTHTEESIQENCGCAACMAPPASAPSRRERLKAKLMEPVNAS